MPRKINEVGNKYAHLLVVAEAGRTPSGIALWECTCDCGNSVIARSTFLRSGAKRVCSKDCRYAHSRGITTTFTVGDFNGSGGAQYPELKSVWGHMVGRCHNTNDTNYPRYGAKGVTVCERWHTFLNFVEDMSPRPTNGTIDRISSTEGYSPENCRWLTIEEQQQQGNKSTSRIITAFGKTQTLQMWAKETGLKQNVISTRIDIYGWDIERALTEHNPRPQRQGKAPETEGLKCISKAYGGKYKVRITHNKVVHTLPLFINLDDAIAARDIKLAELGLA